MVTVTSLYDDLLTRAGKELRTLPDKPEETPESTVRALWHAAAGQPVSAELASILRLPEIDAAAESRLINLFVQRISGIPLAHLTERQRFMGIELIVKPGALIPRKETELLGNAVQNLLRENNGANGPCTIIDLCTGLGNLALAFASHNPNVRVYASDIMPSAIELARINANHLALDHRTDFRVGDLFQPFDSEPGIGVVDVITCNPPYISSGKVNSLPSEIGEHEPREAFDGGVFGISVLSRLFNESARWFKPGGWLAFETGLGQGEGITKRLEKNTSFANIRALKDIHGNTRAILAQRA